MTEHAIEATRRQVLAGAGLATSLVSASESIANDPSAPLKEDLERYVRFGVKASGGPGDNTCGAWLEAELKTCGFDVRRQSISVPFFDAVRAELTVGNDAAPVIPQAIVVPTDKSGISGRFVVVEPGRPPEQSLSDAIALIELPFARWSSALAKPVRESVEAAAAKGARAAVIITNGPTHQAIALNADGNKPMFGVPVAVLAPDRAMPFRMAAERGQTGTLYLTGTGGRRDAFNIVGHLDRGKSKWIVVSTPRSGWFVCAGERGPGIAVWLALARWAPRALSAYNLAFLCNSGHEYENLGAQRSVRTLVPAPQKTRLWLALGAGLAARDWHDLFEPFLPLPSADPQRYLVVSADLTDVAKHAFRGQPGIEAPHETGQVIAGELTAISDAGYRTVAGFFGSHRFHHVQADDERCIVVGIGRPFLIARSVLQRGVGISNARA